MGVRATLFNSLERDFAGWTRARRLRGAPLCDRRHNRHLGAAVRVVAWRQGAERAVAAFRPHGGANAGRMVCKLVDEEVVLKQAKPNLESELKDVPAMRFAVDSEFAAFCVYRIVEQHLLYFSQKWTFV